MATQATVTTYAGESYLVTMGAGEDIAAPRVIAGLKRSGWNDDFDDSQTLAVKVWLAARREGKVPADSTFDAWVDTIADVDVAPDRKTIEAARAAGRLTDDQYTFFIGQVESMETSQGEAGAPRS